MTRGVLAEKMVHKALELMENTINIKENKVQLKDADLIR